ncbi:MAG TPA: acetate/propionate family kinase [Steroidobacteraceae bacterium]|jgi:acetate kinase
MHVLTLNTGSTSVKLAAYDVGASPAQATLLAQDHISIESHSTGANAERGILERFVARTAQPQVVAHRVVHGGTKFSRPACIDESVLSEIRALSELAPLHNPQAVRWIETARAVFGPNVVQVAAFDTSFFRRLPRVAAEYAVPPHLGTDIGVRRYGFHGLAHEAMWLRWSELNPQLSASGRLISLQLGGGASIAAIVGGLPHDTSMGFSPLEGLVMATRSGDLDPAVVPYLEHRLGKSGDEIVSRLNHQSGLAGLSGLGEQRGSDFRVLLADGGPDARFAVDLYCYRARKYIGAYLAVLGGCDGIVFGGGVGEHSPEVRARILDGLGWAGIDVSAAANAAAVGSEARISAPASRVGVFVLRVDEERRLVAAASQAAGHGACP